ncbi:hypothetical protein [Jejuia pallidilutea]|uniref:hypothetical protein n=1 Tax=Jejuia pallidilutea TaxID=504487 RepID=UPI00126A4CB7|nr:hypothetical protein [Jejuia pallidilutea]
MKSIFKILICLIIMTSCSNDEVVLYEAEVTGESIDCNNSFLLRFKAIPLGINSIDNIYVGQNLPEAYKVVGKKINVSVRGVNPNNEDEIQPCTTLGPGYAHVFILSVSERN